MKIEIDISANLVVRIVLAALFLLAGVSKISDPAQFAGSIAAYDLGLPPAIIKLGAIMLPWVEILVGLCLLAGVKLRSAALLTAAMYVLFATVTALALVRGLEISCGCFNLSALGMPSALAHTLEAAPLSFFRNLLLLAASVWLCHSVTRMEARASVRP